MLCCSGLWEEECCSVLEVCEEVAAAELCCTLRISAIMSLGSRDEVVFMLHVKRRDRGLICSSPPPRATDALQK